MGALLSKHPGGGALQYPRAERARGEDASQTPEPGGLWVAQTLQHPRDPPSTLHTWGVTCLQTVHFGVRGLEGSERNRPVPSSSVKTILRISKHTCAVHHHDDSTSGPTGPSPSQAAVTVAPGRPCLHVSLGRSQCPAPPAAWRQRGRPGGQQPLQEAWGRREVLEEADLETLQPGVTGLQ